MFSAQAGAKHVYGVEASPGIYEVSKSIVDANNLNDKITLINGQIEKVSLPVEQVDIIVSEWMGFYLLHESMLNSVIYARDKWLRKDGQGLMYPSVAYLYVCPVEMNDYLDDQLRHWSDYYGLNFEPLMKVYRQFLLEKPIVETIKPEQMIDEEKLLESFDLLTVTADDLKSIQSYDIDFTVSLKSDRTHIHGFAFWFDVLFKTDADQMITLSTSPKCEPTHWKQTIAFLPDSIDENSNEYVLNKDDRFECFVIMNQSDENMRHYQIDMGVNLDPSADRQAIDENDPDEGDDDDDDDIEDHPVPCDCGNMRCVIVKAALQNYENSKK